MAPDRQSSDLLMTPRRVSTAAPQDYVDRAICDLIGSLPDPNRLSCDERRGIIARYATVLEGNFIYWMTATYLSVASAEAHAIIKDNLLEEVRDNHPGMLRRFAMAADAMPTASDAVAVHRNLQGVRQFVARLSGVRLVLMMMFFEGFIMKFMAYLADLAVRQGSSELEYTNVHGVVDVVHTRELLRALDAEVALLHDPLPSTTQLLEGVDVLRTLIQTIVDPREAGQALPR